MSAKRHSILPGARLRIAASCFSIYAYEALKAGEVIVNHAEVKRLFDLVRSACKGFGEPVPGA